MPNLDNKRLIGLQIQLFASDKPEMQTAGELKDKEIEPDVKEEFAVEPSGSLPKEVSGSKGFKTLKQEKIADVITGKGDGSISGTPMVAKRGTASYGGDAVNIAGDLSATPDSTGPTRGRTRFGKKLDPTSRAINDLGSEQVLVEVVGPKPLSESKDEVQGYPGRKLNDRAVRTKTKGSTPASSSYQRSLDILMREEVVFGSGQNVKTSVQGVNYKDIPTAGAYWNSTTNKYVERQEELGARGNYIPKTLTVKINNSGVVTDFNFDVDDISVTTDNNTVLESSAQHAKTHTNKIEAIRRGMEIKSADESLEGWSALPRAVIQPRENLSYMYDLEQETGNHAYMANRFAKLSLAYILNRVGKDGLRDGESIDEAFNASIKGYRASSDLDSSVNSIINNIVDKSSGSPALLITAFDSPTKYSTKADILNQPRSLKMHLNTGNNHIDGLKANADFIKFIENNQVLSTIDHDYDGIHPVFMNSAYRVATATDWSKQFNVTESTNNDSVLLEQAIGHLYAYSDDRNKYTTRVVHPLLLGIYNWFVEHAYSLRKSVKLEKSSDDMVLVIPIYYGVNTISLWQLIVNSAMNHIQIARLEGLRDLMQYTEDHGYPFEDLATVDSKTTTSSKNFGFVSITEPIKIQQMNDTAKLSWVMPELFWPVDEVDNGRMNVVMPWYMGEDMLERDASTFRINEEVRAMNYPVFRHGNILDPMNLFINTKERDIRLSLDMMTQPLASSFTPSSISYYKYDHSDSGVITINEDATANRNLFELGNYMSQPRELGFRFVLPRGYIIPNGGTHLKYDDNILPYVGYTAQYYFGGRGKNAVTIDTLKKENNEVMPLGTLYKQDWDFIFAGTADADTNGLVIGAPQVIGISAANPNEINLHDGFGIVQPFVTHNNDGNVTEVPEHANNFKIATLHQIFWSRLQLLPFIVNPFDIHITGDNTLGEDAMKYDIYDFAYMFGFVGFRTSDFSEDQYLRSSKDISEGFAYVRDRYLDDSLLIK